MNSSISPLDVKKLRQDTGAGIMDCKNALVENNGNIKLATTWLRKNGLLKAQKKINRIAAEGLIAIAVKDKKAAIIEINSETDFVARNQKFQQFAKNIAKIAIDEKAQINNILKQNYPNENLSVEEKLKELIAIIGENIVLRRAKFIETKNGVLVHYLHNALSGQNLGRIGVVCCLQHQNQEQVDLIIAKNLAMHIAAAHPVAITKEQIDSKIIQNEENIFQEQAKKSRKPEHIIEKFVYGQMKKFYQQNVLLMQTHLVDGKKTVQEILEQNNIVIEQFERMQLGENIQKKEDNFAQEVNYVATQNQKQN